MCTEAMIQFAKVEAEQRDAERFAIEAINRDTAIVNDEHKRFEADSKMLKQKLAGLESELKKDLTEMKQRQAPFNK